MHVAESGVIDSASTHMTLRYQTRQRFALTIGCPALHEKARSNSGMFTTTPLTRYLPGECGSVTASTRESSGSLVFASPLREADEEALLGCETVLRRQRLVRGFRLPRQPREHFAAQVRDVLAVGELAVDLDVVDDRVRRELVDDALRAFLEGLGVLLGPPVLEIALGIELAALVVEAVGELVADGPPGVAVVRRVVHLRVIQRG